ncbi:hypothetical protein [Flavobacterium sp. ZB4R12]|uniref:hypothetical protein n=1 Tax=Flavobacterium sp. ZB4R12 TaxID=3398732 RepID=UPI003AABC18C
MASFHFSSLNTMPVMPVAMMMIVLSAAMIMACKKENRSFCVQNIIKCQNKDIENIASKNINDGTICQ